MKLNFVHFPMNTGDRLPRGDHERSDLCRARGGVGRDDGQSVGYVGKDGVRGECARRLGWRFRVFLPGSEQQYPLDSRSRPRALKVQTVEAPDTVISLENASVRENLPPPKYGRCTPKTLRMPRARLTFFFKSPLYLYL